MSRSLTAQDQAILRRVAASLPAGSPGRAILAGLSKTSKLSPEGAAAVRDRILHTVKFLKGKILKKSPNTIVFTVRGNPELKSITFTDLLEDKGKFFFTNTDGVSGGDLWENLWYGNWERPADPYLELFNQRIADKPNDLPNSLAYDLEARIKHVRLVPSIEGLKALPRPAETGWNTSANSVTTTKYRVLGKNLKDDDQIQVLDYIKKNNPELHPSNKSGMMYESLQNNLYWDGQFWTLHSTSYFTGD